MFVSMLVWRLVLIWMWILMKSWSSIVDWISLTHAIEWMLDWVNSSLSIVTQVRRCWWGEGLVVGGILPYV